MWSFVDPELNQIPGILSPYFPMLPPIVACKIFDHPYTVPKGLTWRVTLHPRCKTCFVATKRFLIAMSSGKTKNNVFLNKL